MLVCTNCNRHRISEDKGRGVVMMRQEWCGSCDVELTQATVHHVEDSDRESIWRATDPGYCYRRPCLPGQSHQWGWVPKEPNGWGECVCRLCGCKVTHFSPQDYKEALITEHGRYMVEHFGAQLIPQEERFVLAEPA